LSQSLVAQRLRITFGKAGALLYTSSLDVAKIWERVLRRAQLPILYTQGFNTRPRLQLAMPLPLGISSDCEILDIFLRERIELDAAELRSQLLQVAPQGLSISAICEVAPRQPSLHARIESADYRVRFLDPVSQERLQTAVDHVLQRDEIIIDRMRKRKRSVMDVRPFIIQLCAEQPSALSARLAVGERGNLRPDQLLELMGLQDCYYRAHRAKLHLRRE